MKKRVLSVITALALCLGLLPGTARAADTNVWVLGQPMTSGRFYAVVDGTFGAWSDPSQLDAYFAYQEDEDTAVITVHGDMVLDGDKSNENYMIRITSNSPNLVIRGDSENESNSLTLVGGSDHGGKVIYDAGPGLTLQNGVDFAIDSKFEDVSMERFATAEGYNGNIAISCEGHSVSGLTISSANSVTITGDTSETLLTGTPSITASGDVSITNSAAGKISENLTVHGNDVALISESGAIGTYNITAAGDVTLTSNSETDPTISGSSTVTAPQGTVTLANKAVGGKVMPDGFDGITANQIVGATSMPEIEGGAGNGTMTFESGNNGGLDEILLEIPETQENLTIITNADTTIGAVSVKGNGTVKKLIFSGSRTLTINGNVEIAQNDNSHVAVGQGAAVVVKGTVSAGSSAGANGYIEIKQNGSLEIRNSGSNYQQIVNLSIGQDGTFTANCTVGTVNLTMEDGANLNIETADGAPALAAKTDAQITLGSETIREEEGLKKVFADSIQALGLLTEENGWHLGDYTGDSGTYYTILDREGNPVTKIHFTMGESQTPDVVKYTITVAAEPEEGGTVTVAGHARQGGGSMTCEEGTEVAVTAVPNSGYTFAGWYEGGRKVEGAEAGYTFPVTGNRTLTARFVKEDTEDPKDPEDPEDPKDPAVPEDPAPQPPYVPGTPGKPSASGKPGASGKPSTSGGSGAAPAVPAEPETPTVCDGGLDCPSRAYRDLDPAQWYHLDTDFVLTEGLMAGYEDGTFRPDESLSRAMLAQILYNREGRPAVPAGSRFSDVAPDAWYAPAVNWAAGRGIVEGFEDGTFHPDAFITREQLAVMLWRYAGSPEAAERRLNFADADQISPWALPALRWAVERGIMGGKGGGVLDPQGLATRAEAAKMLRTLIEQ